MKHAVKKTLCTALVLVLLLACGAGVLADGIEPRWKELSTISCSFKRESGLLSNAVASIYASCWDYDNTVSLTVTIQKWNGSAYVDTAYTWSDSGKGSASVNTSMSLAQGNYIAHAVITVHDANNNYVETVTKDSNEVII